MGKRISDIQCGHTGAMVNVRGLMDDVVESLHRKRKEGQRAGDVYYYHVEGDFIKQGGKSVSKQDIRMVNSSIGGSVVASDNIQDSFNIIQNAPIKDELKEQLQRLTVSINEMIAELPKDKADEVSDDMKRLAEEATKPSPNKKWYSVSIDGLVEAAKAVGKIGEPVIKLTGEILKLLSV
jgi:hypothetical protein